MLVWEFNQRMRGVQNREIEEWRRFRWLATITIKPHIGKKKIRQSDLLPLPDDIPEPTMTKEEIERDVENKRKIFLMYNKKAEA